MVVKLTQEQADYLKTFEEDKDLALHYISRWGYGYKLKDGNGEVYENEKKAPFNFKEQEKMLNAIINGYEIDVSKFKFYNFYEGSYNPLYYAGKDIELTNNQKNAKNIEKNSDEYLALESLGFYREEV